MAEIQKMEVNDDKVETKLDDLFELLKWGAVFVLSVLLPIGSLVYWTKFQPKFEVFLTISILYLATTLLLLKPLVSKEAEKK